VADDPLIEQHEQAEIEAHRAARAANLFDIRRLIGGLFVIYGAILVVMGVGASDAEIEKAADVNINLWAGLGMLALGLLFIAWALMRPLSAELEESEQSGGGSGDDAGGPGGQGGSRR
jgi:hypothetical protein